MCMCVYACVYVYVCACVYVWVCRCVYMYVYIHMYMYMPLCIHIRCVSVSIGWVFQIYFQPQMSLLGIFNCILFIKTNF